MWVLVKMMGREWVLEWETSLRMLGRAVQIIEVKKTCVSITSKAVVMVVYMNGRKSVNRIRHTGRSDASRGLSLEAPEESSLEHQLTLPM